MRPGVGERARDEGRAEAAALACLVDLGVEQRADAAAAVAVDELAGVLAAQQELVAALAGAVDDADLLLGHDGEATCAAAPATGTRTEEPWVAAAASGRSPRRDDGFAEATPARRRALLIPTSSPAISVRSGVRGPPGGTKGALPVAGGAPFAIGTRVTVPYSLRYATLAGVLGAGLVWLGPPGIDLAAHLYQRALFDERGFTFWNNFWYAGRYSYVNYSLLYYPLAALVGLKALATASVAVGASAFGLTVERLWGGCARWAAWAFAVALAASLILAAFPYTLGLACALVALAALQAHRFKLFGLLVLATFAASPLAFLILAVVLAAAYARSRRFLARAGLPVLATGAFGLLLWRLFPGAGRFPFAFSEFAAALVFCLAGLAFTWRVERARLLFALFAIYGATCLVCYLVPSDIGANIVRLRYVAIPVTALTLALRRWRPLLPAIVAFALAASWNTTPLIAGFARGASDPSANPSLLGARDPLPAPAPRSLLPGRGGRHHGPLGGGLPSRRGDPDRPRLVPPGRLPAQPAALRAPARSRPPTSAGCRRWVPATSSSPRPRPTTAPRRRHSSSGAAARG